jgi:oligopeptide transport system substrate-binding protein
MYPIKNAEAINTGKISRDKLGVRAVNDRQLEVQFRGRSLFDKLAAFGVYLPACGRLHESPSAIWSECETFCTTGRLP